MSNDSKKGYVTFASTLIAAFAEQGIPLVPVVSDGAPDGLRGPKDWVCFEVAGSGDKMYVNRTTGAPTKVEVTVPYAEIPTEIVVKDMRRTEGFGGNGKIEARVVVDAGAIAQHLLPVMAKRLTDGAKIRANRQPERAARA